jgi:hypothetical protein
LAARAAPHEKQEGTATLLGAIKDKGLQLHQSKRVPYEESFLIGDLLTTRITVLSGEPKAGKTLLSAGMGTALLNGEETFPGQPVLRKLDHIVFGLTDDGAPEELKERMQGVVPGDAVTIFPVDDPGDPCYWAGIAEDLADIRPGLFILDNIIGALAPGEELCEPLGVGLDVPLNNVVRPVLGPPQCGASPVLAVRISGQLPQWCAHDAPSAWWSTTMLPTCLKPGQEGLPVRGFPERESRS